MKLEPLFRIAYTKVLVPVDCTPASLNVVLEAARLMVPLTGAQMTLLATVLPTECWIRLGNFFVTTATMSVPGFRWLPIVIGSHFNHTDEPCTPSETDKLLEALPVPVGVVSSSAK